ncbi:hypothetical protein HIM_05647 [Hirsutella minnesotensis 3608]|uniref:Anaphase-promoting complex subunit 4 WD40 domain-containing protein n=1 Tax=Hirsutella minnesotensis 3608 TaxID=1043627 RepID=A0A0F7ZK25_9HYPO|nr:hypothetical protein HIM_05647 [Hirsutella minnesotensis 3608]
MSYNMSTRLSKDCGSRLSLSLRYRRVCSTTEITSVGIASIDSSSEPCAFAICTASQTALPWIDIFSLTTQRGLTKVAGSNAVFSPYSDVGSGRFATLRIGQPQPGQAGELPCGGSVLIRDCRNGKTSLEIKHAATGPVAWSCDGTAVAAGEGRNRMGVWDSRSGARIGRVIGHIDEVTHAAFAPNLKLVTLSRDGMVRITDPKTAKTLARLEVDGSRTNPRALAVAPSGRCIVSLWGTTIHVWTPEAGQVTSYSLNSTRRTEGWPLCISSDCRWMACRTECGFDVVDLASGTVVWEERRDVVEDGVMGMVTAGAFSSDGALLILGRMDGVVEVWDVEERWT